MHYRWSCGCTGFTFQQEAGSLSAAPGDLINSLATVSVTLIPVSSTADAGLTCEIVEISAATHLPLRILGYGGPTLVRKIDFSNVKLQG